MSTPFLGEIRALACNFAPYGWAFCAGQTLSIQQNTALFSLLGTNYGGNGTTNFQLPDLRGRAPIKYGNSVVGNFAIGETGGEENVTLQSTQTPPHTHNVFGSGGNGGKSKPTAGSALGTVPQGGGWYAPGNSTATNINAGTVSPYVGGGQPHTNVQPYLAINWCIALTGVFPARN